MNSTRYIATLALLLLAGGDTATAQTTRGFLAVNGGWLSGSKEVRQAQTFDDVLFGPEQGRFTSTYPAGGGTAFDISVGVKVWRQLAFGAGVSLFSRAGRAAGHGAAPAPVPLRPAAKDHGHGAGPDARGDGGSRAVRVAGSRRGWRAASAASRAPLYLTIPRRALRLGGLTAGISCAMLVNDRSEGKAGRGRGG